MARYSNEQIIEILRNLASNLGKNSLTQKDISTVISVSTIYNRFGNIGNALEAAGLERAELGYNFKERGLLLTEDDLFYALYDVELQVGHEPKYNECRVKCKYSTKPYRKRFGKWPSVLASYNKWKLENTESLKNIIVDNKKNHEIPSIVTANSAPVINKESPVLIAKADKIKTPEQFYGEPIDFRGLRHAPINEQGVVFLFAIVSRELGFYIESVQQGFPDCEGKYLYNPKKNLWAKARIEFEYKALSFLEHGHDSNQCDFIVCWENNWPESPLTVIELKTEILKLPSH